MAGTPEDPNDLPASNMTTGGTDDFLFGRNLITGAEMDSAPDLIVLMQANSHGGLLNRPELVIEIADLLARNHYPDETIAKQRPLQIIDDGDRWTVVGTLDREMDRDGQLQVVLRKSDGAVLNLALCGGAYATMSEDVVSKLPPHVQEKIREQMAHCKRPKPPGAE